MAPSATFGLPSSLLGRIRARRARREPLAGIDAAQHRRELAHRLGESAQVGVDQGLRPVDEGGLRVGVHVDDDAIGTDRDRRR